MKTIQKLVQINNYIIQFNMIYEKYQVRKGKVIYEEFTKQKDAINWAKENKN